MDETSQPIKIGYYLDILSRRRWYIIIPFCLVMLIGIYKAITSPEVYSAETLILVQPQKVNKDYISPMVSAEIESRVNTISQQVMSRSNLEKIIAQFNLFMGPNSAEMYMEDKVEYLRRRISVEVTGDERLRSTEAFSIAFFGSDPELVMHITNALAANFIDENLRIIEAEAVGTSDFLEEQLQKTSKQLDDLEQHLKSFRTRHMGGLPEQLQTNLRSLDQLQMQVREKQSSLNSAKTRLISLNNQLSETQAIQQSLTVPSSAGSSEIEPDPYVRLQMMKRELEDLSSRYTPRHPDIVRLKQMIKDLEQKIEAGTAEMPVVSQYNTTKQPMHPILAERRSALLQQIAETELEIRNLKADTSKLLNQIAYYQKRVDETPKKEQEFMTLQRDYENLKSAYNSLLERKLQAEVAVNLEKKKKGEQFRILDRARIPARPVDSGTTKLFLLTLIAALGLGGGLTFLLEYFDNSIRQTQDLESDLGIAVLASIPKIYTTKDKAKYGINKLLTYASIAFAFLLCAGFAALVLNGVEPVLEMVKEIIAHS